MKRASGSANKTATSKRPQQRQKKQSAVLLLVATRKGAWIYRGDGARQKWRASGPHFLGHVVNHVVLDPRDGKTLLAAARTGHLGPTVFRSTDFGKHWHEAARPPAFPKAVDGSKGRVVDHVFWLTPGHASEPGVWYAGTSPQGLFRSEDAGVTWNSVTGFNEHPMILSKLGGEQDGTPDGPKLHSISVDPHNAQHLYLGMSSGGVHESYNGGRDWQQLIEGLDVVAGFDVGNATFHDPHCVRIAPSDPNRLYQQNHCGIYRIDRPANRWTRIGRNMPKMVGDIGFPLVIHPRDPDTVWVFPMDGTDVWPRTSPAGKPAAYVTRNGGKSWQRQDKGLPREQAWWTVKRQAMACDARTPVGLYFGTTSGEVWASRNEGAAWKCIAQHLPHIYAVETAELT